MNEEKSQNQDNSNSKGHNVLNIVDSKGFSPSLRDNRLAILYKKTERLLTALYMITDFIDSSEPLKIELRTAGITLLKINKTLQAANALNKHAYFIELKAEIEEIISLLGIAGIVGFISEMNGQILHKEFLKLSEEIKALERENTELSFQGTAFGKRSISDVMLAENFLKDIKTLEKPQENQSKTSVLYKGHVKDSNVLYGSQKVIASVPSTHRSDIALRLGRRNTILKLIKEKKEVTIKDISSIVSDCSEKTIQRELNSLVSEGVLEKRGEKRWRRYLLK